MAFSAAVAAALQGRAGQGRAGFRVQLTRARGRQGAGRVQGIGTQGRVARFHFEVFKA